MSDTPPQTVEATPNAASALAAFIAQELEQWDFAVTRQAGMLYVTAAGREFTVTVSEWFGPPRDASDLHTRGPQ